MRKLLLGATVLTLAACGGGGSDSGGGGTTPTNRAPTANAGAAQTVDEFASVTLDGSGSSDPDAGTTLTYSWAQQSGTSVTLSSTTAVSPTFDAPDVTAVNTPETLRFQLTVSDGSLSNSSSVDITVADAGLGINSPPTADAGPNQSVLETVTVDLDGSGSSDPDGNTLSYSWSQTAGPNVTLTGGNTAQPSFPAPDVTAGNPVTFTFELTVDDGSDNATDSVDVVVSETATLISVAGKLQYEFVPPNVNCRGLNFNAIQPRPIRGATVQLVDGNDDNIILDTTQADPNGDYSFSDVAANLDVRIRVRAELKEPDIPGPGWDVEIRDNVDLSPTPPPLESRPLYVVQWASFNTGGADISDADYTATTGWGGSSYTTTRAAAPLAILDQIYTGMQSIIAERPNQVFPPLNAFWSINNTLTGSTDWDIGELSASFYSSGIDSLFLLGDASVDTEEFDDHVVMHEWGHYFEDNFSRSDSIGGSHFIGDSLDARLAFGEGFATALAAIVLEDQQYCDTQAAGTTGGFGISTETENGGDQGWMNEMSVATLIYDLWDTDDDTDVDGADTSSIGFGPILDVMMGPQANTSAFTSLFSFSMELQTMLGAADLAFLNAQLERENVEFTNNDIWGGNQGTIMTAPNQEREVLPLYTNVPTDGSVVNICTNTDYDPRGDGNKLAESRFFRVNVTAQRPHQISVTTVGTGDSGTDAPSQPAAGFDCQDAFDADPDDPLVHTYSDPDWILFSAGLTRSDLVGLSCTPNAEVITTNALPIDTYVFALTDYRHADEDTVAGYPERVCYDVSVSEL